MDNNTVERYILEQTSSRYTRNVKFAQNTNSIVRTHTSSFSSCTFLANNVWKHFANLSSFCHIRKVNLKSSDTDSLLLSLIIEKLIIWLSLTWESAGDVSLITN